MKDCLNCSEPFKAPKTTAKYCCRSCFNEYRSDNKAVRECKATDCYTFFPLSSTTSRKVYCSTACSNRTRVRSAPKHCKGCSGVLANSSNVYCSIDCLSSSRYEDYISKWLSGSEEGGTEYGPSAQVRRYIKSLYGMFCWNCRWDKPHPDSGVPPLQIDHIDGDSANNRPENLRLLCPNCHSLTPTFGNRGKRKSSRTYRYDKPEK